MVKIPDSVVATIKKYITELEKNNYPLEKVFLYGSYAQGTQTEWSDIDIALVSPKFIGDWFTDKDNIRKITLSVDHNLSPKPFRPEDFDPSNLFVKEILRTGIQIV